MLEAENISRAFSLLPFQQLLDFFHNFTFMSQGSILDALLLQGYTVYMCIHTHTFSEIASEYTNQSSSTFKVQPFHLWAVRECSEIVQNCHKSPVQLFQDK